MGFDFNRIDELKYAMELGATIPFDTKDKSYTMELYDQIWWCLREEYTCDNCIISDVDFEKFKKRVADFFLNKN